MTEHPIFVPYGDDVIAGVVTVPEGTPRGVVLWLQGQGASSRAHKYRLWVRGARKLAEHGIGTLRMDLPGMGESTGAPPAAVDDVPTAQAAAILEVAMRALGVDAFALSGHCYGATAVFDLAEIRAAAASGSSSSPTRATSSRSRRRSSQPSRSSRRVSRGSRAGSGP